MKGVIERLDFFNICGRTPVPSETNAFGSISLTVSLMDQSFLLGTTHITHWPPFSIDPCQLELEVHTCKLYQNLRGQFHLL